MSNRFIHRADICDVVQKLCAKVIFENKLIEENDRILIAASGGKDSTVLAWALSKIKPIIKFKYELFAVHISSEIGGNCDKEKLGNLLKEWEIPFIDLFVPVIGRLKDKKKMNCYWCSTQRRSELLNYAITNNYNKIALGHHLDDIIETYFMNLFFKSSTETMPILLKYRKYPITLIRPLALLEEAQIINCAEKMDFLKSTCTCSYGNNSTRKLIRKGISSLFDITKMESGSIKRHILEGIQNN
jgi:tRNA 2-thiocytidine biosynthesis protein TtcA